MRSMLGFRFSIGGRVLDASDKPKRNIFRAEFDRLRHGIKRLQRCEQKALLFYTLIHVCCSGGWPTTGLEYMKDQGISDGKQYTFKAVNQKCQRTASKYPPILKIPNACEVEVDGNENVLKKLIAQYGPVAGTMGESKLLDPNTQRLISLNFLTGLTDGFFSYKSGVYFDKTCSTFWLDHAIVSCPVP